MDGDALPGDILCYLLAQVHRAPATVVTATEIAGFVGAGLSGAAYVPQITHLIKAHCSAGVSRTAFDVWLLASLLLSTRAIAIQAGVFIVLGGIQIAATTLVLFYATRYKDGYCPKHITPSPSTRRFPLPPEERQCAQTD
jgi:hypothetical protein